MTKQSKINVFLFLLYGSTLYASLFLADALFDASQNLSLFLIFGSLGLGIAGQLIFDWHFKRPMRDVLRVSHISIIILLVTWLVFAIETAICVIMVWPVMFMGLWCGLGLTRALLKLINNRTQFCLPFLVIPFMTPMIDLGDVAPMRNYSVSTQVEMKGTPDQLRALTLAVPLIADAERPWTFTHSVLRAPRPLEAQVIDGVRYAKWERGVSFQEILMPSDDPTRLSWTFAFPDPSLLKPLDYRISPLGPEVFMDNGGYHFESIGPNRTRVTLSTTYRLQTAMNGYFALWGKLFLDDFHMAVLHVIAQRAETKL